MSAVAVEARRRARRAGFSLLELVLVVAIVATAAAIAAPRYSASLDRYRISLAARRIAADLDFARADAEASSADRTVVFELATDRYEIVEIDDPDHPSSPYVVDVGERPFLAVLTSVKLDDPASADDAENEVVFDGYGVPDSGGTIVVKVGALSRTISIDGLTGRTSISP